MFRYSLFISCLYFVSLDVTETLFCLSCPSESWPLFSCLFTHVVVFVLTQQSLKLFNNFFYFLNVLFLFGSLIDLVYFTLLLSYFCLDWPLFVLVTEDQTFRTGKGCCAHHNSSFNLLFIFLYFSLYSSRLLSISRYSSCFR